MEDEQLKHSQSSIVSSRLGMLDANLITRYLIKAGNWPSFQLCLIAGGLLFLATTAWQARTLLLFSGDALPRSVVVPLLSLFIYAQIPAIAALTTLRLARRFSAPGFRELLSLTPLEDSEIIAGFVGAAVFKLRIPMAILLGGLPLLLFVPFNFPFAPSRPNVLKDQLDGLSLLMQFGSGFSIACGALALSGLGLLEGVRAAFDDDRSPGILKAGAGMVAVGMVWWIGGIVVLLSLDFALEPSFQPVVISILFLFMLPVFMSFTVFHWAQQSLRGQVTSSDRAY